MPNANINKFRSETEIKPWKSGEFRCKLFLK